MRGDVRTVQGLPDHVDLSGDPGGGETDLARAVVVHRGPDDHGVHGVAVRESPVEGLEENRRDSAAAHRAVGVGVEGTASSGRRQDGSGVTAVAGFLGSVHGGGAGESQFRVAAQQGLHGEVHRHERGGAGGLDADGGSAEPEPVGDPGGHEVRLAADRGLDSRCRVVRPGNRGGGPVLVTVQMHAGSREDADADARPGGGVASVLQGLVAALEEQPVGGIGEFGLPPADAEEVRVEAVGVREIPGGGHPAGLVEQSGRQSRRGEVLGREDAHAVDARAQVAPELVHRGGAREACGHADDGDPPGVRGGRCGACRRGRVPHSNGVEVRGQRDGRRMLEESCDGDRVVEPAFEFTAHPHQPQ